MRDDKKKGRREIEKERWRLLHRRLEMETEPRSPGGTAKLRVTTVCQRERKHGRERERCQSLTGH